MQRLLRLMRKALSALQVLAIAIGVAWSPIARAVEVQLKIGLQLEQLSDAPREERGLLRAGSVVDIPNQFRVNGANGKLDSELTLNNWLKNAGRTGLREEHRAGGVLVRTAERTDYFYPVQIVKAAPGSDLKSYKGKTYFLALRILKKQGDQLVTREDTRPEPTAQSDRDDSTAAQGSACLSGTCRARTAVPAFDRLMHDLGEPLRLAKASETRQKARTAHDFQTLSREFARSCGFSLDSFIPVVRKQTAAAGVPADILLSMMVQESSGHCFARNTNGNLTSDRGLWGINSNTSSIRRCSSAEIDSLRHSRATDLVRGPQCIENPVVNLNAAIAVLKNKAARLSKDLVIDGERHSRFDERKLVNSRGNYTRDAWRLAASAYNGGEKWVFQAKTALLEFNHRNGTNLDPYNWDDLRVFYLRGYLSNRTEEKHFGTLRGGREKDALANLAYTENIAPKRRSSDFISIDELWLKHLARND